MADNFLENLLKETANQFTSPISDPKLEISQYVGEQLDVNTPLPQKPNTKATQGNEWKMNMELGLNSLTNNLMTASQNTLSTYGTEFGAKGMNFDRYYQGGNKLFRKLGFVPTRDNESLYKQHISVGEDLWRGLKGMERLAGVAFADSWSFGPKLDTQMSSDFEDTMGTYSSIKGGLTGFATNNILNAGYTVGIIGQFLTEEAVMHAGMALTTRGAGNVARAPVTIAKGAKAAKRVIDVFKQSNKLLSTLDNLSDINKARTRWQKIGRSVANFALPTESVRYAKNLKNLENLNGLQKTSLGVASFFRDIRSVRYAFGESALEGGSSYNELMDRQMASFQSNNGRLPNSSEMAEMEAVAKKGGNLTFALNMPVIYFSNKIVLGSLFKAASPFKNLVSQSKFARIVDTKGKVGRFKVQTRESGLKGLKNVGSTLKSAPLGIARSIGNYTTANLTEGLQEVYQEAVSSASNEYTDNVRKGNTLGSFYDYLSTAAKEQISPQGFETFASGFLMGGLIGAVSKPLGYVVDKSGQALDSEGFNNQKEAEIKRMNDKVELINKYFESNPLDYFDPKRELLAMQNNLSTKMEEAVEEGNEHAWMDLQDISNFETFASALQTGTFDSMVEEINQMRQLTPDEIKSEYGFENTDDFYKYVDKVVARANSIKDNYLEATNTMPNPYAPWQFEDNTSSEAIEEMYNYLAHQDVMKTYVMAKYSFMRNKERRESVKNAFQNTLGSAVSYSDVNPLFGRMAMESEIASLNSAMESFEGYTPSTEEAKNMVKNKAARLAILKDLSTAIDDAVSKGDETSLAAAKSKLAEYIKTIGNETGNVVFESSIEEAFVQLMDYYKLNEDAPLIARAVDAFLRPQYIEEATKKAANEKRIEFENKKEYIRAALEKFNKAKETNRFLQSIAEGGVFFDVDQFADFEETGKMPNLLFSINDGTQLLENSPLYQSVIERARLFGIEVFNVPIPERRFVYDLGGLKQEEDNRTFADISKYYGEGVVGVRDVLKKVAESEFADDRMRALANSLLNLTSGTQTISFTDKGVENVTIEPNGSIAIDARYNSFDFAGNNSSIEHAILHGVLGAKIQTLDEAGFNSDIDAVIEEVKSYVKENDTDIAKSFPKSLLNDRKAFALAAMTNESVQAMLSEVPYNTPKGEVTLWDAFTKSITDWLKRVLGKNINNTALNGAINASVKAIENANYSNVKVKVRDSSGNTFTADGLITHYTDFGQVHYVRKDNGEFEMVSIVETLPIESAKFEVGKIELSSLTPIEEIKAMYPELYQELVNEYANFSGESISVGEAESNASFTDFVRENTIASDIISDYLAKNGMVKDNSIGAFENRKTSKVINKLKSLGFTNEDITGMDAKDAYDLAYNNITKSYYEIHKSSVGNKVEELTDKASEIIDKIEERELSDELSEEVDSFVNSEEALAFVPEMALIIENKIREKVKEQSQKVDFENVAVGDILVTKEGEGVIVSSIKGDIIIGEGLQSDSKIFTFDKDSFKTEVVGRREDAKGVDTVEKVNNTNSENLSNDSFDLISDLEFVDAAVAEGDNQGYNSAVSDFLSDINNCK